MNRPLDSTETIAHERDWQERNHEAVRLGLAWLRVLLDDHPEELRPGASKPARAARKAYDKARADLLEAKQPARIDRLSATFRLAPFDEDVLLLALAPRLEAEFSTLFERAQGRVSRSAPTMHLALALFRGDEGGRLAQARFGPAAPLRRYALIECADPGFALLSSIGLDERLARYLIGEDLLDERVRRVLAEPPPGACPERQRAAVDGLARQIAERPPAAAVLLGPGRSGRRAAAGDLAGRLGLRLAEVKPRLLPSDLDGRQALLPLLAREAALAGLAFLIDADPAALQDEGEARRAARQTAEDLLGKVDALVIAVAEEGYRVPPGVPHARLAALETADRSALWNQALPPGHAIPPEAIELAAEHFKLGPGEIAIIAEDLGAGAGDGEALWRACRETARAGLEELAERIAPNSGWDDIVLPASILHDLRAIAAQVRHRTQVYGRGGFGRKLARGRGITALFAGPSGVGKTMAAEVIARELGLDLYRIDLSSVISKYIGETEKNLKRVFDAAECSGAVLFFDEADALFGKRSEVKDSHDRYANIEVSYLLQRMESYSGLAILATNMKGHLDAAFLRRLRFVIDMPFPDASQRRAIWAQAFPAETATEKLDLDALSRIEIAGGNIVVIAVNAAFLAADEGRPVGMTHIARAARAELRKLDKAFKPSWMVEAAADSAVVPGAAR